MNEPIIEKNGGQRWKKIWQKAKANEPFTTIKEGLNLNQRTNYSQLVPYSN